MRTTKPISTVWFGSEDFLKYKLDGYVKRSVLDFYVYIHHLPEDDEKKEHCHVYCVPSNKLDTQSLRDDMTQFDPNNPEPIIPLPFRSSKFDDWYLYNLHDTAYLMSKNQSRKYHYKPEEMRPSNADFLTELVHQIDYSKIKTVERVKQMIDSGMTFADIVSKGVIPIQQIRQYQIFCEMYKGQVLNSYVVKTHRNGHKGHEEVTPDDVPF